MQANAIWRRLRFALFVMLALIVGCAARLATPAAGRARRTPQWCPNAARGAGVGR